MNTSVQDLENKKIHQDNIGGNVYTNRTDTNVSFNHFNANCSKISY